MVRSGFARRAVLLGFLSFPSMTRADEDAAAKARALYQDGARLYNLGQYDAAVQAFEGSYAISGAKPLLFNIAQAYRLAGPQRCEKALHAYESYLREDSTASNRREVEERIAEMRECVEREQARRAAEEAARARIPPSAPAAAPRPEPTAPPAGPGPAPAIVTAAGGALFLAGAGLYAASRVKFNQVRSTCPCPEGSFSKWETLTTTSYVALSVGGATLLGGLSWWLASPRSPASPAYALTLRPDGIGLVGNF
jgi:hypothetical protein